MFKIASLISLPPNVVKEITDLIEKTYAGRVLGSENSNDVKKIASRYTSIPITTNDIIIKFIDIDFKDWSFLKTPNIAKKIIQYKDSLKNNKDAQFEDVFNKSLQIRMSFADKSKAYYSNDPFTIPHIAIIFGKVDFENISINDFFQSLYELHGTIQHELTHWAQDIFTDVLSGHMQLHEFDAKETRGPYFGLPPNKYRSQKNILEQDIHHSKRDIEFYTNLVQIINYYKIFVSRITGADSLDKVKLFKDWVGINGIEKASEPFKTLLLDKDPKYRLAVKIFWKEIQVVLPKDK